MLFDDYIILSFLCQRIFDICGTFYICLYYREYSEKYYSLQLQFPVLYLLCIL